tara:strand:+ start:3170 stop:4120 length:951 start_codon:yes stop_codon:yes gene_type:complete
MSSTIKVNNIQNLAGDDSGFDLSTNDVVAVKTANTERMRVDANGNVGIGTSSPDSVVNIEATKTTALSSEAHFTTLGLCIDDNTAYNTALAGGGIAFRHIKNSSGDMNVYGAIDGVRIDNANGRVGGHLRFFTNQDSDGIPTERVRIDSSGNLFVHGFTTSNTASSIQLGGNGQMSLRRGTGGDVIFFINSDNGNEVGKITVQSSSTVYATSSDHRLKENVVTDWDATTRLKQLKPSRFNFKVDKDKTVDGFLAHEVSSIVPEAITGKKDAVDKDGNPEYQGIDQSKIVPLLTKALQEAVAKIETLEAKVTALEGK